MADPIMPFLNMQPEEAVAWAATFMLHSTLLIGSIWLLTRLLGMKAMAVQDKLWKVAITGALFSCTVQAGLGDGAIAPRVSLSRVSVPLVSDAAVLTDPAVHRQSPGTDSLASAGSGWTAGPEAMPVVQEYIRRLLPIRWQLLILLLWGLGAAGFTGGLVLQLLRLRSRFRDRREITSGPLYLIFRKLVASRPTGGRSIRLTESDRIPVPVACGIRRPEICLPRSMVLKTVPEQLKSVLAHELAHIVRRDQAWLLAARLAECIFFFQPLVCLARRRYQETAEFICDGEAVRLTGERVPLARSLHEMARRRVSTPTALTIPGISGKGSPLNRRIEMILDKNRSAVANRARWFGPLAVSLVLVFAFLAPGVTAYDDPPRPEEAPPAEAQPAPAAPDPARQVVAPQAERVPAPEVMPAVAPVAPRTVVWAAEDVALSQPPVPSPPADPVALDDEELSEAEAAELAEMEHEMEVEAEEMVEMEREMEIEAMEMAEMEREMEVEAEEMAEFEREMELMEHELAEQEEALIREEGALIEQEREDEEAGAEGDAASEEVRARKEEIRRHHAAIRERHREISSEHREISRQHRDAARRQAEALRQRRAVFHAEETALRAQRRGLERALREMDASLAGSLTEEQRERLTTMKLDIEERLRALEENAAVEQAAAGSGSVPRPEELD